MLLLFKSNHITLSICHLSCFTDKVWLLYWEITVLFPYRAWSREEVVRSGKVKSESSLIWFSCDVLSILWFWFLLLKIFDENIVYLDFWNAFKLYIWGKSRARLSLALPLKTLCRCGPFVLYNWEHKQSLTVRCPGLIRLWQEVLGEWMDVGENEPEVDRVSVIHVHWRGETSWLIIFLNDQCSPRRAGGWEGLLSVSITSFPIC